MSIEKKRRLQHKRAREEMIERLGGKMPEEQNGVSIELDEPQAKMLERALNRKNEWDQQERQALNMLTQIRAEQAKAQGKIDGAIELIAEVKGFEYEKMGSYSVDTEARYLILSFQKKDPEPDKESTENKPAEHEHSEPQPLHPDQVKEEETVGSS